MRSAMRAASRSIVRECCGSQRPRASTIRSCASMRWRSSRRKARRSTRPARRSRRSRRGARPAILGRAPSRSGSFTATGSPRWRVAIGSPVSRVAAASSRAARTSPSRTVRARTRTRRSARVSPPWSRRGLRRDTRAVDALARLRADCAAGDVDACAASPGQRLSATELCAAHDYSACAELGCAGDPVAAREGAAHAAEVDCDRARGITPRWSRVAPPRRDVCVLRAPEVDFRASVVDSVRLAPSCLSPEAERTNRQRRRAPSSDRSFTTEARR